MPAAARTAGSHASRWLPSSCQIIHVIEHEGWYNSMVKEDML